MKTIIVACVHNAGRSQMAAAIFNKVADPAKARALYGDRIGVLVLPAVRSEVDWSGAKGDE